MEMKDHEQNSPPLESKSPAFENARQLMLPPWPVSLVTNWKSGFDIVEMIC
jgi:hypothetical protein